MWRWDQGRLSYFSLGKIRKIAATLVNLDGAYLDHAHDPIRADLQNIVGLPFAPSTYTVWRNYSRVFKVLGLASRINGKLVCTNLCKAVASSSEKEFLTYDEYLHTLARIFYYPSPIFQGYDPALPQVFPFCSIMKRLFVKSSSGEPFVDLNEVFGYLIGNQMSGTEEIAAYSALTDSGLKPVGDQGRQVREMLIFISQISYLLWADNKLFIDPALLSKLSDKALVDLVTPIVRTRDVVPDREIQNMNSLPILARSLSRLNDLASIDDVVFTEGMKTLVSHFRTERNRNVIKFFLANSANPHLCDMCQTEVRKRYPWAKSLIEVHHVLPLSSPLYITKDGTSMKDLIGLCPNCHRATHVYYRIYLKNHGIMDFESDEQAHHVYSMAKSAFATV